MERISRVGVDCSAESEDSFLVRGLGEGKFYEFFFVDGGSVGGGLGGSGLAAYSAATRQASVSSTVWPSSTGCSFAVAPV